MISTALPLAIVTGGAGAIGQEITKGLINFGYNVALTSRSYRRAQHAAICLNGKASPSAGAALPYVLNVLDYESCVALVNKIQEEWGPPAVLVNNAGVYLEAPHRPDACPSSALEQPVDMVRASLEANLLGPYELIQLCVPLMQRVGYGRIVNVSSGSGQLAEMGGKDVGYRISKTGLNALTRIVAAETVGTGLLVNAMCPGWVRTQIGGPEAPKTPEQGAKTAIWLATLPPNGPTGGFFRDCRPIPW